MSVTAEVKRADWLELFFDLVFVYAIAKATHAIAHPHDGHIAAQSYGLFFLILVPIWWAWTGHTLFSTRFGNSDAVHRLLTLTQMMAALFLAVFISPDFDPNYLGFLISYVCVRFILIVMYLRIGLRDETAKIIAYRLSIGFGIGLTVVLCSLLFTPPLRYFVLFSGIAIEVVSPIFIRRHLAEFPVDNHHMPERFGLLTIILLGESVVALGAPMSDWAWTQLTVPVAVLGFTVLAAAWWLYFTLTDQRIVGRELGTGQRILYGHLPLYAGLAIMANSVRFAINPVLNLADHVIMSISGAVLFLGALIFIHGTDMFKLRQANIAAVVFLFGSAMLIFLADIGEPATGVGGAGH